MVTNTQRWTLCAIYTLLITIISLSPSSTFKDAPSFPHLDKLVHFFMYGIEAVILLWSLTPKLINVKTRLLTTILICSAYGILMEVLQATLQPNDRTFSFGDIIANIAGATSLSFIMIRQIKAK